MDALRDAGPPPSRLWMMGAGVTVTAVFAALYANGMHLPFWHDDVICVVRGLRGEGLEDLFWPHHFSFVRPTSELWFRLLAPLCERDPFCWRLGSAALFLITAALLARCTRQLGAGAPGAFITALFFVTAAHHWELVYGVAAVEEVLAGVFMLVSLSAWLDWRRTGSSAAWALSLLASGLAAGAKESGGLAPLMLALYELLTAAHARDGVRGALHVLPHLLLTSAVLGVDAAVVSALGRRPSLAAPTLVPFVDAWGRQLCASLATVPVRDAVLGDDVAAGIGFGVAWLLLAAAGSVRRSTPLQRSIGFLMAWMAASWLPYLLLASGNLGQDRYGYLASLGLAMLVGVVADAWSAWAAGRSGGGATFARAVGVALLAGVIAWNARCHLQASQALRLWLERRGDMAAHVRDIEASCPAGVPVYIFTRPDAWHEAGYAFVLFTGRPLEEVRDGWDLPADRPARRTLLLWNEAGTRYITLDDACDPPLASTSARPWVWNGVQEWRSERLAKGSDGSFDTEGSGVLVSPPIDMSPWDVERVVVTYRAWRDPSAARESAADVAAARMVLSWSDREDAVHRPQGWVAGDLQTDGAVHEIVLRPWLSPDCLRLSRIRRFAIVPADRAARVEVIGVRAEPLHPDLFRPRIE